jgi:hypothetical protein
MPPTEARAYPRPLPNPEWLGKLTEEILEPDLPIVDPHHHLWDHPGGRHLLLCFSEKAAGRHHITSPAASRRPDRNSSRCSGLLRQLPLGICPALPQVMHYNRLPLAFCRRGIALRRGCKIADARVR